MITEKMLSEMLIYLIVKYPSWKCDIDWSYFTEETYND